MKAAPFSEPREWQECDECQGDRWHRYFRGDDPVEDAFAPCPKCGQPPRCTMHLNAEPGRPRCPRPATCGYVSHKVPDTCGQHYLDLDLSFTEEEWEIAGEQVGQLRALAEHFPNPKLLEALDIAFAQCEMGAEAVKRDRRVMWGDS